jgi:hypothetical protein|tara:strand:+ start:1002 stop:1742 length:741 start_codon:yes stop_codon:yes gene_type:complete
MIELILDTDIWISHIAKDNPAGIFESFKKQVEDGEVILLINQIIKDEWNRNKENTIRNIVKEIKNISKTALKMKPFLDEENKIKIDVLLSDYNREEKRRIELAEKRIEEVEKLMANATEIEVTDEMKVQVSNWALEKRAPFTRKANSVGDALILLSAVKYRHNNKSAYFIPGFFVSFNHTDYSKKNNESQIHEDLEEILEKANLSYKRHIGEVLKLTPELNIEVESYIDSMVESYLEDRAAIRRGK